jgi:ribosomal protein S18 acetylase RimI-like enzyme
MHIRYMDFASDGLQILSSLPELYESNFPGFQVDAGFIARKRTQLREANRAPGQAVFVAEDDQGVCGFIWLFVEEDRMGGHRGEVSALFVDQRVRGQSVGRGLMEKGETFLHAYGCDSVFLMVTVANESAVKLYDSLGYQATRFQMEKPLRKGARS